MVTVLTADHDKEVYNLSNFEASAAAIYNMCLLAHEAGLATCWMTGQLWVEKEILQYLNISGYRLAGIIPIGYADQDPPVPPRKDENIIWMS